MTLTENDPFAKQISEAWNQGLMQALEGYEIPVGGGINT